MPEWPLANTMGRAGRGLEGLSHITHMRKHKWARACSERVRDLMSCLNMKHEVTKQR